MRSILGLALLVPSIALAQPAPTPPAASPDVAPAASPDASPDVDPAGTADPNARVAAIGGPSAGGPAVRPPSAAPLLDPEDTAAGPAAPTGPTGLHLRLSEDAAAGRAFFTDTALTAPRGSVAISLRAPTAPVGEVQLRYSLTDRIELGAGGVLIASGGPGSDDPAENGAAYSLHAKAQLWRNDRAAVAVGVSRYAITEGEDGGDALTLPSIVASTCLDGAACTALVSVSLNGFVVDDEDDVPIFAGIGWALGRRIQFVGELHYSNDEGDSLSFGYVGLRGAGRRLAVDAGIGFASEGNGGCSDCSADTEAFPFIGVATRM